MITVATPAPIAISAAMSLVSMPPVPSSDPEVAMLTGRRKGKSIQRELTWTGINDLAIGSRERMTQHQSDKHSGLFSDLTCAANQQKQVICMNHRCCNRRLSQNVFPNT